MNKNLRYEILPQMRIYDQIGYRWLPFIMFSQTPNFRSDVLNTDNKGLRFNSIKKIKKKFFIIKYLKFKNTTYQILL